LIHWLKLEKKICALEILVGTDGHQLAHLALGDMA